MTDALQTIVQTLEKNLSTKQVFGETLVIGGVTMVPVMDLSFGFGGGMGEGRSKDSESGTGGGGGGAAKLAPKAILVISEGKVSVLPITKGGPMDKIMEALPGVLEKVLPKKGEEKAEVKAEEQ
ncbi:MAG TPA: spore germination protein GerW family protein [Symbiobacteriaceae bacterium]|jgi:uncharacterized spore protein YtfJ